MQRDMEVYNGEKGGRRRTNKRDSQEDNKGLIEMEISYYMQHHAAWSLRYLFTKLKLKQKRQRSKMEESQAELQAVLSTL